MSINVRLANESWEALFTAHTRLMQQYQATNIWQELSMREYDVLYTLVKRGTPTRLGELRDRVLLSQPALSRLVDRLVERRLIERTVDGSDKRAVHLALTDAGRSLQQEVGRAHAKSVAHEMAALDDDELSTLAELCNKLVESPNLRSQERSL